MSMRIHFSFFLLFPVFAVASIFLHTAGQMQTISFSWLLPSLLAMLAAWILIASIHGYARSVVLMLSGKHIAGITVHALGIIPHAKEGWGRSRRALSVVTGLATQVALLLFVQGIVYVVEPELFGHTLSPAAWFAWALQDVNMWMAWLQLLPIVGAGDVIWRELADRYQRSQRHRRQENEKVWRRVRQLRRSVQEEREELATFAEREKTTLLLHRAAEHAAERVAEKMLEKMNLSLRQAPEEVVSRVISGATRDDELIPVEQRILSQLGRAAQRRGRLSGTQVRPKNDRYDVN